MVLFIILFFLLLLFLVAADEYSDRLKAEVNFVSEDDGAFYICLEDFIKHFNRFNICRIYSGELLYSYCVQKLGLWCKLLNSYNLYGNHISVSETKCS
jgi:hypothetical protein